MVYSISYSHKHPEARILIDGDMTKDFVPKVKEAPKSSFTTAEAFAVVGLIGGSKWMNKKF